MMPRVASLAQKMKAWTPWKAPTAPPAGTYDPSLDAQLRAAQRGYGDLGEDAEKQVTRTGSAYFGGLDDIQRGQGRSLAEILRQRTRAGADTAQARQRLGEDVGRATSQLGERFKRLGASQSEQQARMGASEGAAALSLGKRLGNKANEQVDIDRSRDRGLQDITTNEQRFNEDSLAAETQLNEDADLSRGRLAEGATYEGSDLASQLGRAGRELGFFGQDTSEQKFFQAAQSGQFTVPGRGEKGGAPSNEFSDSLGPYRIVMKGGRRLKVRPSGKSKMTRR